MKFSSIGIVSARIEIRVGVGKEDGSSLAVGVGAFNVKSSGDIVLVGKLVGRDVDASCTAGVDITSTEKVQASSTRAVSSQTRLSRIQ
jgi:hypothetical protein